MKFFFDIRYSLFDILRFKKSLILTYRTGNYSPNRSFTAGKVSNFDLSDWKLFPK